MERLDKGLATSRMRSQFFQCEPAHTESEMWLQGKPCNELRFWKKSSSQNRRSRRQAGSGTTSGKQMHNQGSGGGSGSKGTAAALCSAVQGRKQALFKNQYKHLSLTNRLKTPL